MVLSRLRAILRARMERDRDEREALEALHLRHLDLLQRVRIEATQAVTVRRQLEGTIARLAALSDERATQARVAVGLESDDHVRGLLREEQLARSRVDELAPLLERLRVQESVLMQGIEQLAQRVDTFATRKASLVTRLRAADTTERLARDAQLLRDETAAIDRAVVATHETATELAARTGDLDV